LRLAAEQDSQRGTRHDYSKTSDALNSAERDFASLTEQALAGLPSLPEPARHRTVDDSRRTVIEGSYIVEKEERQLQISGRRAPITPDAPGTIQPLGRRRSQELVVDPPATQTPEASCGAITPATQGRAEDGRQLSVAEPTAEGTALSQANPKNRKLPGRRKSADDDRIGAFVTDRLVLREESRRFWMRLLWGVAATISLLALATLGYIVLTNSG
jgi:hypothetical protein